MLGLSQHSAKHSPDRCQSNKGPGQSWGGPGLQQHGMSIPMSMLALQL